MIALSPNAIESWGELARVVEVATRGLRLIAGLPTDLRKGIESFSYAEVLSILNDVVDAAAERMPQEAHEGFFVEVRRLLSERR